MNGQMARIQQACEVLKLSRIAVEWSGMADRAAGQNTSYAEFLAQVLQVEIDAKLGRSRDMLLKFAGFPAIKQFEDYDFKFATGAPHKQLQELTSLAFVERAENIVLLGPSGVGKSHLFCVVCKIVK